MKPLPKKRSFNKITVKIILLIVQTASSVWWDYHLNEIYNLRRTYFKAPFTSLFLRQ